LEQYLKDICAPHFWPIVITIGAMLILMGNGVAIRPLLKKLFDAVIKRMSGESVEVVVNPSPSPNPMNLNPTAGPGGAMPDGFLPRRPSKEICEDCTEHRMVTKFIKQNEKDKTELFRKVNRTSIQIARISVMVEMLCHARGLTIDPSKIDLKLQEEGE